jgi:phosphoribosylamine--glycine ligase
MRVLVLGGGGREHALAWKLVQSPMVSQVLVSPGNGGTAADERLTNVPEMALPDLVQWAKHQRIGLTVVGPEAWLACGVVDAFRAEGLAIVGPTQRAAQLETSKSYAKAFMQRHGIPTAAYQTFTERQAARDYIHTQGAPIVVKADGLAAGKGVVVAASVDEALQAVDAMLPELNPNQGARVVIEACLQGEEASFMVLCDGETVLPLATSQDHKRLSDGDQGPNTGGMGAYSPAPVVTPELHARIMREVIKPAVQGMAKDGEPYTGFLYAGVMIDAQQTVHTLEFNCRLGDPETQPILMRLRSDLAAVLLAAAKGCLGDAELDWDTRCALGVVLAAAGYPQAARVGDVITGLPGPQDDLEVFHAGTVRGEGGVLQSAGGRVLCATALGANAADARRRALEAMQGITLEGGQYRRDIGWRAAGGKR